MKTIEELNEIVNAQSETIENLQLTLNALIDNDSVEMEKISAKVEREIRLEMIKNVAKAIGIYIYDDKIEMWVDDPEFINGGTIHTYMKVNA